jgi:hypothetical protein
MFAVNPSEIQVEAQFRDYLESERVRSISHNGKAYTMKTPEGRIRYGGLLAELKRKFYPHFEELQRDEYERRKRGPRGSNTSLGKLVDRQIMEWVRTGKNPKRQSKFTAALRKVWRDRVHVQQAAQVPVFIPEWQIVTQADVITRSPMTGKTCLWEVKTGMPHDLGMMQGKFSAPMQDVCATKLNIWHLQLHYTALALRTAGLTIDETRIIQVYGNGKRVTVDIHEPPPWTEKLPRFSTN